MKHILILITSLAVMCRAAEPVDMAKRAEELKNLRWGMFICWSFSTFSEKEWTPGVKDVAFFKATEVDTDQWARTAKEAGMGYILFLAKHHDGFCLWDTKTTDRKVTKAPLGRDVLAELRKSCDKYGIKLALYFSEGDWSWPGARDGHPGGSGQDADKERAQLTELLTGYGPIEYLWVDHAAGTGGLSHAEFIALCKKLQPGCFVGFNHGDQNGCDIRLGEMGKPGPLTDKSSAPYQGGTAKSYLLAEFTYPILPDHSGGAMWFYSLPKHDRLCRSAESLYKDYLGAAKYGNIFSIDVGPDYNGKLREVDVTTLRKVGEMIKNPPPLPVSEGKPSKASSVWGPGYDAGKAFDGDESTRWGAAPNSRGGWIEVDLGKETRISHAVVAEIGYPRTQEFVIEYKSGDTWKELHRGATIAGRQIYDFPAVNARYVRLNILKATDVPTIEEFQLYPSDAKLPAPTPSIAARPEAIEKWKDMRFGMFICWGPVTLTGKEIGWSRGNPTPVEEYDALYKKWNPEKFDAREWAKVVKDTGCKYVVFLLKHHDGFCLWDTKQTDYNVMNSPFKRDITKEFAVACREQGIGFFPYYSTCDWHHPDFPVTSPGGKVKRAESNLDRYTEYLEAQTKELITNYGPLVGIWFDVPQCFDKARGERVIRHVRSLQPDILVNNRTGAPGDFDTPEQTVGRCQFNRPWESCITLGTQWTWKPNDTLKPYTDAIRILVACAVGDGNLALNTNPMPDGQIEPRQVENFKKIGDWLSKYGESIYGTRGGPFVAPSAGAVQAHGGKFVLPGGDWWGGATHKGNVIYLHILRWPGDTITLPAIKERIIKHTVLTGGEATVKQVDTGIEVSVPSDKRDAVDTIIKLELDGEVKREYL